MVRCLSFELRTTHAAQRTKLMYKKTTLPNGIRIVSYPVKDRDSVSIGFFVGVGARHESDSVMGAAHFLEHIVFKGSKQYSCDEIKNRVEGVGGMLNAFTGDCETCYYAKIPAQYLQQTFETFADMVYQPKILPSDMTKEKTVIVEEIKMYRDLPQYQVSELLDEIMWPNHPMGRSLAGTPESVTAMTSKNLRGFHGEHYNGHNTVIAVCGKCSHEEIVRLANQHLKHLKSQTRSSCLEAFVTQNQPRFKLVKKTIEQTHLTIGFPAYHQDHPQRYAMSLLNILLGGNMSSRLFVEIREKRGLAYSIGSSVKYMHDVGTFTIRAGVENAKTLQTIELIIKELKKIRKSGVTSDEFKRAKDYVLGQLVLGVEDTMEHMLWLGESEISRGRLQTIQDVLRHFEKVTPVDVLSAANDILTVEHFSLAAIGPMEDQLQKQIRSVSQTW